MSSRDVMPAAPRGQVSRSRVLHGGAGEWEGIAPQPYRRGDERGGGAPEAARGAVTRWLLAGGPASACAFELRYFELAPGAHTSHERHLHEHAVVVLRGTGEVRLGETHHPLRVGDLVTVAADEPHQFRNAGAEPFGFLCVVDAERDRPTPVGDEPAPACDL